MVEDQSLSTSPPPEPAPAKCGVPSSAKSRTVRFCVVVGQGLLWAAAFGSLAYFYGLYDAATRTEGFVWLIVLAAVSIFLVMLFSNYPRRAALVNYEFAVFSTWFGYFSGSIRFSIMVEDEWFFWFFWSWVLSALVGGLLVASRRERRLDSTVARTLRVLALVVLVGGSGLLACGFAPLLLFENRPLAAFCTWRGFFLENVGFSPDGETLATIGHYGVAELWSTSTGTCKQIFVTEESEGDPQCAAVQFESDLLALAVASSYSKFGSPDRLVVRMWDVRSGKVRHSFQWNDELYIRKPVFSADGELFVYSSKGGHIRVFDLHAGRVTIDLKRNLENVRCIAVTPKCDLLACATEDEKLEVWDVAQGVQKPVASVRHSVSSVSFSSDGTFLACGTKGGSVDVVDVDGVRDGRTIPCFEDGAIHSVAFSPDGTMLVCGGGERGLTRIIDTHQWKIIATLRTWGGWHITCLAFSPDGRRLATGDALGRVATWDMMSLKRQP